MLYNMYYTYVHVWCVITCMYACILFFFFNHVILFKINAYNFVIHFETMLKIIRLAYILKKFTCGEYKYRHLILGCYINPFW